MEEAKGQHVEVKFLPSTTREGPLGPGGGGLLRAFPPGHFSLSISLRATVAASQPDCGEAVACSHLVAVVLRWDLI